MRIGSICSGYGGLEMAAAAAFGSGAPAWFCEVDDAASLTLKRHHPDVPNHGSVVGADWSAADPVHLLTMGPPCQPVSAAGRQRAEADPRWLWPDALRAIRALRPRGVIFENVRNLVSIRKGEIWHGILEDFREAGYAVRWLTLGACAVGAPHHRHRVFLLAVRSGSPGPAVRVDIKECDAVRPLLPTPTAVRYGSNRGGAAGRVGPVRYSLDSVDKLLPTPTARDGQSRGEGSPEYWQARAADRDGEGVPLGAAVRLIPTPRGSDAKNGGPNQGVASGDLALSSAVIGDRWGQFTAAVAHWGAVLGRPAPEPTELGPRGGLRLAPELPEWMQGLPAGYLTGHLARADALRLAGNGVCPRQGEAAIRALLAALGSGS